MFFEAHGFRCDQRTLDVFVSSLVESEIASFRLRNHGDIRHFGRPVMKVADPTREIKVCE